MSAVVVALYVALVVLCCAHGVHRLVLLTAWWRHRRDAPVAPPCTRTPPVTVQLPVFNERDVVARVVDAVAALDWPADKLTIQLLDDSTDDTVAVAAPAVARARARGIRVEVLRRETRAGFKAGALDAGLRRSTDELFAIFDADFVPDPGFLRRVVPCFADAGVGMVQAAWGHLDARSPLARAEAALLDGHFVIEHAARFRSGRWFNFNGTGGVWRRSAIAAAGGWQGDTLTEDLDLSYRAQLAGWRFVYVDDHVVPAELPEPLSAFRSQQHRWARGSIQVARKLGRRVLASDAPLATRMEAIAHLTANLGWLPALALAGVLPLLVFSGAPALANPLLFLPAFLLSTGTNLAFYTFATRGRFVDAVLATVLAVGMTVNQAGAVRAGMTGVVGEFARTPKRGDGPGSYRASHLGPVSYELAFAVLHLGSAAWAAAAGTWGVVPFLLLFGFGFTWTGLGGLAEVLRRLRTPASAPVEGLAALGAPVGGKGWT